MATFPLSVKRLLEDDMPKLLAVAEIAEKIGADHPELQIVLEEMESH